MREALKKLRRDLLAGDAWNSLSHLCIRKHYTGTPRHTPQMPRKTTFKSILKPFTPLRHYHDRPKVTSSPLRFKVIFVA